MFLLFSGIFWTRNIFFRGKPAEVMNFKNIMQIARFAAKVIRYLWAGPCTLLGLLLALAALSVGATVRLDEGTLEVAGGRFGTWISRLPVFFQFYAIALGHVIVGVDEASLHAHRGHERVHVRQYERWGILFIPMYCASSFIQFLRGHDPYLENRFEREACLYCSCPGGYRGIPPSE